MLQITAEHHNFKVIQLWEPEAAPVFARARQTQRRNLAHPCREFTLECARAWPRSPRVSESVCLSVGGQTSNDRDDDDWREIEFACNPLPSSTSFPPLTVPEREVCILGRFCFCKALLRPSVHTIHPYSPCIGIWPRGIRPSLLRRWNGNRRRLLNQYETTANDASLISCRLCFAIRAPEVPQLLGRVRDGVVVVVALFSDVDMNRDAAA